MVIKPHRPQTLNAFLLVSGQAVDENLWFAGGLFGTLLPAINGTRSGRAECAGMGSRTKQKIKEIL